MNIKKPLAIKLNCPRNYETATKYWEESGVNDHCAGCGGTKAEHIAEVNAIIREQQIKDELKNFQGVTFVKKWSIQKEKAFGFIFYWGNYNFPFELTLVIPFLSIWVAFGSQKEH